MSELEIETDTDNDEIQQDSSTDLSKTQANAAAPVDLTKQSPLKTSPYFIINAPYDYSKSNNFTNQPRQNTGTPVGPSAPALPFNDGVNAGQVVNAGPVISGGQSAGLL